MDWALIVAVVLSAWIVDVFVGTFVWLRRCKCPDCGHRPHAPDKCNEFVTEFLCDCRSRNA